MGLTYGSGTRCMYSPCVGVTQVPLSRARSRAVGLRLLSDDRLARMVASGNETAFEVISERYQGALYRHCRGILNHHEDASDALQNTLLNAFRALSSKPRDLALRPWLYRIAHNESISLLRRRRPHAELDEAADVSRPGADHDAETNARLDQLVADLQQLSERQRGALVMREISGLSYAEISASFAISENAAKQTVHEAHSALHELEEGRAMDCEAVRSTLSVGDRRLLRGRKVRAHLRGCNGCTSFHDAIHARRRDLAALAPPIPAALGVALLHSLFGGGGSGGGGLLGGGGSATGATAATTTAAGGGVAATTGVAATAAATTAAATTAAATTGAASAGASGGFLAALTSATGPALAGAGVVKSLVPAAVGLTVGAGALGLPAPQPVTRAITEVERALEPRKPIQAPPSPSTPAPSAAPGASSGASILSQAPSALMQAPSPVTPLPLAGSIEAQRQGAIAIGSPIMHVGPQATPTATGTPAAPPLGVGHTSISPAGSTPTTTVDPAKPVGSDPRPAAKHDPTPAPSSGGGTRFESVEPTEAPPSPPKADAPAAAEPPPPAPDILAPAPPVDAAPILPPMPATSDPPNAVASSAPVAPAQPPASEAFSLEALPTP